MQNYALKITPQADFSFKGEVAVSVDVVVETDELAVNSLELQVQSVHIKQGAVEVCHGAEW